ncbi:hypothetical protein [Spirillospora sp. NPDC029432]|uniref:hypothetical protein n=1 Tax=Spirillospora sp. NPDC029432 TaxID=3154599 RepID=UPI003451F6D8
MAARVVLHIGQQKSGTTYLQEVLGSCTDGLAAKAGILFPPSLREILPDAIENHERATYGLLGTEYPWVSAERAEGERRKWVRLAERVREWPGTVLLSAEALSVVRAPAVGRLADELRPAELDVVVTTRALGRTLPSLWQQHVRNGRALGAPQFFESLAEQRERGARAIEEERHLHLWRSFALGGLVRRWAGIAGRVTVVVNPGSPPDLLWRRFAEAVGAPCDLPPEDVLVRRTHAGLTLPETELLTYLNRAIEAAGWDVFEARALRERILAGNGARGPRAGVPEAAAELVRRWSDEDIDDLGRTGAVVLGDVEDLRFRPERDAHRAVSAAGMGEAAAAAIMAVADRARFEPERRRRPLYRRLRADRWS